MFRTGGPKGQLLHGRCTQHVHYNVAACRAEEAMPDVSKLQIQSRILHLPMAFRESCSKAAMDKYAQSVRPEAAYLPDNVPFVADINGLKVPFLELPHPETLPAAPAVTLCSKRCMRRPVIHSCSELRVSQIKPGVCGELCWVEHGYFLRRTSHIRTCGVMRMQGGIVAGKAAVLVQGGVEEVRKIMFEASYMVFGLGDVYLGAPCAVPVNPLHRCAPPLSPNLTEALKRTASLCV